MFRPKLLPLLLSSICLAGGAHASYFLVVPMATRNTHVEVPPPAPAITVSLSPSVLPAAKEAEPFNYDLRSLVVVLGDATYDSANVEWSLASGALPVGVQLTSAGFLTGTVTESFAFTARATYKTKTDSQGYSIAVLPITITLQSGTPPVGATGEAYTYDLGPLLTVSDPSGFKPASLTWSAASGLPPGITLDATGKLTGSPSQAGSFTFNVSAAYRDHAAARAVKVDILAVTMAISGGRLTDAPSNRPYTFNFVNRLTIDGAAINPTAATWAVSSGALPAGLSLSAAGMLTGSPSAVADSTFQVRASYKAVSAVGSFNLAVLADNIVMNAGARQWSSGASAKSCEEYIRPPAPYIYSGATGDGLYTIRDGNGALVNAYCDMTTDGGGWTLTYNSARNTQSPSFVNEQNITYVQSPVSNSGGLSGSLGASRWFNVFPFTKSRIDFIAGDNPNVVAKFYKTVTRENVISWTVPSGIELAPTTTCTNAAMTTGCTTRPFDHDSGGTVRFWGVEVDKYGYQTVNPEYPVHGAIGGGGAGWCSVTVNINNNAWPDSFSDGHWGNGMRIWFK